MWARARLKKAIISTDTYFQLADNIGFDQVMVGDIIIMDRTRSPEHMLVTGFDENQHFIQVQRGYNGTTPGEWKKGAKMRIFRILNAPAITESRYEDREEVDGTTTQDILTESYLVYEWKPEDTCLPGCYWLEFKLLKMKDRQFFLPGGTWVGLIHTNSSGDFMTGSVVTDSSVKVSFVPGEHYQIPYNIHWEGAVHLWSDGNWYTGTTHDDGSVYLEINGIAQPQEISYNSSGVVSIMCDTSTSTIPSFTTISGISTISQISTDAGKDQISQYYGCALGVGVEWVRRFPLSGEGFLVRIYDSPTAE
jgi:hypothetical protein